MTRELGRNTGKWLSNKVFKDGWSTPYRFSRMGSGRAMKENKRSALTSSSPTPKTSAEAPSSNPVLIELRNLDVANTGSEIVDQLEFLLAVLIEHQGSGKVEKKIRSVARAKCRLALHRLRSQDPDAAHYFASELKSIRRRSMVKILLAIVALIALWLVALVMAEL